MVGRIASVLLACLLASGVRVALSKLIKFEADAGDVLKPKQPLLASRDGRFIRFDTKDTEIELELGVSVPFLKIPLHATTAQRKSSDSLLTVNPAGLLVGATIFLTTYLLVPLIVPPGGPLNEHKSMNRKLGSEPVGSYESDGGFSSLWQQLEHLLVFNKVFPSTCSQKAICYLGQYLNSTVPNLLDSVFRIEKQRGRTRSSTKAGALEGGQVDRPKGGCEEKFPTCDFTQSTAALIARALRLT